MKSTNHIYLYIASFVKSGDSSQTDAKRKARAERFKNDAKKILPPKPKRSFAHPGGKITHNKEAALAAYLKRKKGRLTEQQKAMLANLEKLNKKKGDENNNNVDNEKSDSTTIPSPVVEAAAVLPSSSSTTTKPPIQ